MTGCWERHEELTKLMRGSGIPRMRERETVTQRKWAGGAAVLGWGREASEQDPDWQGSPSVTPSVPTQLLFPF